MTAAERKARERARKKAQGLLLKQIWVHPNVWPIVKDLSTGAAEHAPANSESYGREVCPDIAWEYERAREILQAELAGAEVLFGKEESPIRVANLIRALLKSFDPTEYAHPRAVEAVKGELE